MYLTELKCKNTKPTDKTQKLSDGGGMYLEIPPSGSKYWRLKYRFMDKEKRLALGVYPMVGLKEAREKRDAAKKLLAAGKDPGAVKKQAKQDKQTSYENSFESIAREWHSGRLHVLSPRHAANILKRFEADVFPRIGSRPINELTAKDLLTVARAIESRGALDLAKRFVQISGQIFRYAVASGRAERDPSSDLRGALKTVKTKNRAYLQESEIPEYLAKLEMYEGQILTKLALKFLLLTFVRSAEQRGARWEEINFEKAEWRIPAERMKMKEQHIVPLARQTIDLLKEIQIYSGNREHLFPSQSKSHSIMSENTLLYALYRMGYHSRATGHGFRSTASTILNEHGFRPDVIERQLAHGERDQIRSAYNHAEYLKERREMMQWWADFLTAKGLKA